MSTYTKTEFVEGSAPGITAAELNKIGDGVEAAHSELASHEADYLYQTAGGTGTAITLTISETLVNGLPITFIAAFTDSNTVKTINGKPFYKPGTTTSPSTVAGKAYTVWYNLAGNCFFIKASATGTATPAQVLAEVPYSNENDTDLIGTIPILSGDSAALALSIDGTTLKLRPPKGYKDGVDDTVSHTDANRLDENIKKGIFLDGHLGTHNAIESISAGDVGAVPIPTYQNYIQLYNDNYLPATDPITVKIAGVVRIKFGMAMNNANTSYYNYAQVMKNGVVIATFSKRGNPDANYQEYSTDVPVSVEDTIQIYGSTTSTSHAVIISNMKFCTLQALPLA